MVRILACMSAGGMSLRFPKYANAPYAILIRQDKRLRDVFCRALLVGLLLKISRFCWAHVKQNNP